MRNNLICSERVFVVPHGVDTAYFTPDKPVYKDIDCIFVGRHLRDFVTLSKMVQGLEANRQIRIAIISDPEHKNQLLDLPNVQYVSGIANAELRVYYRRSQLLLLPLLDCTANNALLDARVWTLWYLSDLPSIADLLTTTLLFFIGSCDAKSIVENVIGSLKNTSGLADIGLKAGRRAKQLSWECVAKEMLSVYSMIVQLWNHELAVWALDYLGMSQWPPTQICHSYSIFASASSFRLHHW